ncbi:chaplin, partial [Streptomyces sp. NPDC042638]
MRQTLSKGMVVAAAATGVLSLYGGSALADTHAHGATQGSPGVLSGNNVQAPVNVPVNVCGNSVDVAAALNPAFGNSCAAAAAARASQGYGGRPRDDGYGGSDDHSGTSGSENSGGSHSAPPYGGEETTPPGSYGGDETTPSPYGGDEKTPPAS